jgi:hypothetical protein
VLREGERERVRVGERVREKERVLKTRDEKLNGHLSEEGRRRRASA